MDYRVAEVNETGGSQCSGVVITVDTVTEPILSIGKIGSKKAREKVVGKIITLHNGVRVMLPANAQVAKRERWSGLVKKTRIAE